MNPAKVAFAICRNVQHWINAHTVQQATVAFQPLLAAALSRQLVALSNRSALNLSYRRILKTTDPKQQAVATKLKACKLTYLFHSRVLLGYIAVPM